MDWDVLMNFKSRLIFIVLGLSHLLLLLSIFVAFLDQKNDYSNFILGFGLAAFISGALTFGHVE